MTAPRLARLTSIELQGYKTFAARTEFRFSPTITAIVGPNGSGKSNIADSIRWVLGEQTYSLLRGKKTEDMIFAGSEGRARASMASATITFDNSDGWLPIEFGEVTVGRRAYRDGENEYFLNGQRVRLRDVTEVLAKSGLAQRTYTIIGQGLVDAALSLRAEERRALFEEAAGIGLYRSRREEALRRLESTERNLERAQDILAELKPRLRGLERQARRAQEFDQVRGELKEALRVWYGHQWQEGMGRVARAREQAAGAASRRDQLRQRQAELQRSIADWRSRMAGWRAELHQAGQRTAGLTAEMEGLRRRAAVAQERRRWLEAQAAGLREEIQHAQASLASLSERISAEEARLAAQAAAAEPEVSPGPAGHPQGGPAPADARQPLDVREAIWRSRTDSVVSGHSLLKHALEDLDRSLGLEREAHTTWSSQRERARAAHAAGAAGVRQGVERVESARDRLTAARAHVRTLEQERARLIERRSTLEGRLEALAARRKVTERLEQAARAGTLRGWHGRSGPAWRVAPAHRTAISAALGEFEDALAFASPEELDEAWTWIQADLAPTEAALLPLRPLKETEALPVPDDPDCLGLASDLVAAAAEYQPALRAMLGRTLIVRDADAARRLRGGLPPGGRLVTLQGEIYHPHGAVSLRRGADPHDADARLRQDLERTIAELNARTEDSTRLEAAAEARAAELAEAEAALARAHAAQTEAALEEQATLLHSQAARQRQEDLEARHTDLAGRLEASENELRLLAAVGNDIAHERAEFGAAGVAPLRPSAEARDAEVLRVAAAEARRRIDDLAEQVTALNSSLEDRKARLTKAGQQEQETVAELDQSEASLQTLSDRQDELKLETAPVESYLEEGEAARAKLEGEEGESRIALQRAEADAAQTLVEQARREEELSALQRRIEDDFGLVAYPYDESATGPEVLPLEGLVESLPVVEELPLELEGRVLRLRNQMRRMGAVNPEADREYQEVRERVEFLSSQTGDLRRAEQELREVIAELDELMEREFRRTFEAVATAFRAAFTRLFQGGSARLILSSPEDLSQSGIEIEARLPGKREQGLAMLSGGERSLTACALVFALLKVSPTPFCVLDEVDAMLDEANVTRFREILAELAADTQFIVITHNRETVQAAQTLYGVTMGPDSASQVISLRLEDAQRSIAA